MVKKDSITGEPLKGVEFKITTSNGELVSDNEGQTSTNGIYTTDENGVIEITRLKPGTYTIVETKTLPDYVLDAQPQTVVVEANDTQTLVFTNTPKGCLVVKKIDSVTHEPLSGVKFEVKGCDGCDYPAGTYTTDSNGMFRLSHIPSGCYSVVETQVKDGYRLDDTVHTVKVEAGACKEVTFENAPLGGLLIKKMAAGTKEPLSDVTFTVLTTEGAPVGTSNGKFRTNEDGYISIPDLAPGTYIVKETQAKPGYVLDDTPQTITVKDHQTYTLELFNKPKGNLVVVKTDSQTGEPLPGVEFKITTANGEFVPDDEGLTSSNGVYKTNENGEIVLSKIKPGTYVISESKTLDDYILDAPPQTVVIEANDTQVLNFKNTKKGCLVVTKVDSVTHEPLSGVKFEIKGCNGNTYPADIYTTNSSGVIQLDHIPSGDYTISEVQAKDGYQLNAEAQVVSVEAGKTRKITFENEPLGGLLIKKMAAGTKEPLSDVTFTVLTTEGAPVGTSNGKFRTNEDGYISIPELAPGAYIVKEVQAKPGYLLDDTPQTITIKDHQMYTLEVFNRPKGNLVVVKTDSQTGEPLPGVEFKITTANGELVPDDEGLTSSNGIYRTNENGEIVLSKLKPGTYLVSESKTLDDYILDASPKTVVIESNDTQVLNFTNTKKGCLVVTKVDSVTREPLSGVKFEIKGCNGNNYPVDTYTTNDSGVIQLDHIPSGDYTITETQAKEGYRLTDAAQVVSVEAGMTRKITVKNVPLGGLLLKKMDAATKEPLSEVVFKITRTDGSVVGESGGEYRTDERGYISIPDLAPGGYVIEEVQAKPGYLLDNTPKNIDIKDHQMYVLEFFNKQKGGILIVKKDSQTGEPLAGVEFKVTTANGEFVPNNGGLTSTNGVYTTNEDGKIEITNVKPGTYTVSETKTLDDYVLDAAPQTVVVEANDQQTLAFTNTKKGCLVVTKVDSVTHEPLSGVKFEIKGCNGNAYPADTYVTNSSGVIQLDHIPSGDYTVAEVQAKDGYRRNTEAQVVSVEAGKTRKITFENEPLGGLLIKKMAAGTKEPLSDVIFTVLTVDGTPVGTSNGQFRTNEDGYISIPDLAPGTYIVKEVQAKPGYLLDDTPQTVTVKDHQTHTLELFNKPKGNLVVIKTDNQTGEPLPGVEFKITTANGELVPDDEGLISSNGVYKTNENGEIVLSKVKPGTYLVSETKTLDDYILDAPPQTVVIEANDTQVLNFTNTKKGCLVITKVDSVTREPLSGVKFEIKGCNGNTYPAETCITNDSGVIQLDHIPSGDYTIMETKAKEGYRLTEAAQVVNVEAGKTRKITVENEPLGGLLLKKMDAATKEPLSEVVFKITRTDGSVVGESNGEYRTDERGYISIPDLAPGGYVIEEVQAKPGYLLDNTPKNIDIKDHQTYVLEFFNKQKGGILIVKKDSQTGEPLAGVEFKIGLAEKQL